MLQNAIKLSINIIDKSITNTKFYDKIREIKISPNQSKAIVTSREQMINNGIYRVLTGTSQVQHQGS